MFKRFKNTVKSNLINILALIIIITALFCILEPRMYLFTNFGSAPNFKINPYTANLSKKLNSSVNFITKNMDSSSIKLLSSNISKSKNYADNEYNYTMDLYLGKYEYDSSNTKLLSNLLLTSVLTYKSDFNLYVENLILGVYNKTTFSPNYSKTQFKNYAKIIENSLIKATSNKPYTIISENTQLLMTQNEVLLPIYRPTTLYTTLTEDKILNKITINENYYFDLTDKNTHKTTRYKFVTKFDSNSITNNQVQGTQFCTKMNLSKLFNDFRTLKNDSNYITYIVNNYANSYFDTTQKTQNWLNNINQLTEYINLLSPILPNSFVNMVNKDTDTVFNNNAISLLNEYKNSMDLLYEINSTKYTTKRFYNNKSCQKLIRHMEDVLSDLINEKSLSFTDLKPLFNYQKLINNSLNDERNLNKEILTNTKDTDLHINNLINSQIKDIEKFTKYSIFTDKMLETAGLHHLKLYVQNINSTKIVKDRYSKTLNLSKLYNSTWYSNNRLDIFNPNMQFIYTTTINPAESAYHYWIRLNPSEIEKMTWNEMQKLLIKNRYTDNKIRINVGLIK